MDVRQYSGVGLLGYMVAAVQSRPVLTDIPPAMLGCRRVLLWQLFGRPRACGLRYETV